MKKNNVLIVAANGLGKSGVPNVICQVVEALSEFASIDVVTFNNDNYYSQKILNLGANIIKVDEKEPKSPIKRLLWRLFLEKHTHKIIFKKLFNNKRYICIHSFKEYDSAYCFAIAHKHDVSDRILHCNNEIKPPKSLVSRLIFNKKKKLIKKYTTRLIGVSSECCKISYPGMSFNILFNTYDESTFNQKVSNKLENKELVLTQVATYSGRKNQLFSLKVFELLLKDYPSAKLNLIGFEVECGYLNRINDFISKHNLNDSVNIIDGSNGVADYFQRTSYILLPSLHEAAPITLVEAQACGIMCFASDHITRDMNCGGVKYLPIDNPKLWADEIVSAFSNVGNVRTNYDMTRFSSANFKKQIKEIYGLK